MSSNIYTRVGDKGETSLLSGTKIKKSDLRLEIYGSVDELNSWLGLIITQLKKKEALIQEEEFLKRVQSTLFDMGSLLACEKEKRIQFHLHLISVEQIFEMEGRIDKIEETVGVLKNFILPGGSEAASFAHLARTVCRRVERMMVSFDEQNPNDLPDHCLVLMNRFSDYLFILARLINKIEGQSEVIWRRD